jgi:tripartite-type tricarboxylate transporter receptor subunit TctC
MKPVSHFVAGSISLFLFFLFLAPGVQGAESFPQKPISIIIPTEAGADNDVTVRPLLEKASALLPKPFVPVNKPGAGMTLAYREVQKAKPDGHTLGVANATIITSKLQGFIPYDYKDFTHLGHYWSMTPVLFASTKVKRPFKTAQEAFAFAKVHPGEVSLATTAVGGAFWTAGMLLVNETRLDFNFIPQEGSASFVLAQLAGGHMDLGIAGTSSAKPQIDAGNVLPLAVIGPKRIPGKLNYVPTMTELGYPVSITTFGSVIGPAKIPQNVCEILIKAIKAGATDPEYQKFITSRFDNPWYMSPDEFYNYCEAQKPMFTKVFEKAGLLKVK